MNVRQLPLVFQPPRLPQIELTYTNRHVLELPIVSDAESAYEVLRAEWSKDMALREEFRVLILDNGYFPFLKIAPKTLYNWRNNPETLFHIARSTAVSSIRSLI